MKPVFQNAEAVVARKMAEILALIAEVKNRPLSALDIREIAFALTGLNQVDIKAKVK